MNELSQLQQYVALIKDTVGVFSSVVLAIIAYLGLQAWKKQLKGKTEYELARRLLHAVYKTRDAIRSVRNPFASASELTVSLKEVKITLDEHDPDFRSKSQGALYQNRWKAIQDALIELDVEGFEAEVVWGKEIRELLTPLRQKIGEIHTYLELYLQNLRDPTMREFDKSMFDKIQEVIYDFHDLTNLESDNLFTKKTVESIMHIEEFLKPKMRL